MSALIIIDPIGDIEIVLTQRNPPVSVLVSSKCLTLASKVFAVMLSPRFLEGASLAESGMAKIELEDDANTTTIILQALHHRNTKIPEALGVFELHSLALIVDKYELFEAILPWFRLWIAPYRSPDTAAASLCYEKWLLISWVSNESSIFTSISKKLLMESRVGEDGEMVTKEGQRFSEGLPDRIVGRNQDLEF